MCSHERLIELDLSDKMELLLNGSNRRFTFGYFREKELTGFS
jgi:hypothetical protein